jgi:acyl-CoA thioester hydrolase
VSGNTEAVAGLVGTTPRPHPARLQRELYPVAGVVAARFGDMDANGHLNNLALESMHENARATMNMQLFPGIYDLATRQVRLVSSQNAVHFLAEAHWPATIQTGVGVGRIGRTSYVASSALFSGGTCVSVCDTVLVAMADGRPLPIPDDFRKALERLMLGAA